LLEQDCELDQDKVNREEMTYPEFQKSWTKINNSTPKRKIDPALVWLEIKSYIYRVLWRLYNLMAMSEMIPCIGLIYQN